METLPFLPPSYSIRLLFSVFERERNLSGLAPTSSHRYSCTYMHKFIYHSSHQNTRKRKPSLFLSLTHMCNECIREREWRKTEYIYICSCMCAYAISMRIIMCVCVRARVCIFKFHQIFKFKFPMFLNRKKEALHVTERMRVSEGVSCRQWKVSRDDMN